MIHLYDSSEKTSMSLCDFFPERFRAQFYVSGTLHPYVVRRQESPQPNPVFLVHLRDLRGAIIVAGRKNFATEVKQSLEAEIKKRAREDGKREKETEKRRDIETGGCPGFDRNKGDHLPPRLRSLLPCAAFLCSTV